MCSDTDKPAAAQTLSVCVLCIIIREADLANLGRGDCRDKSWAVSIRMKEVPPTTFSAHGVNTCT